MSATRCSAAPAGRDALADIAILIPLSWLTLAAGVVLFKLALDRERRLGTLGMY